MYTRLGGSYVLGLALGVALEALEALEALGHVVGQLEPVQQVLVAQRRQLGVGVLQDVELLADLRRQRLQQLLVVLAAQPRQDVHLRAQRLPSLLGPPSLPQQFYTTTFLIRD